MNPDRIRQKVENGIRLSPEEGLELYEFPLWELGRMGDAIKKSRHGNLVTYLKNYYLSFTNICKYACKYCGFRRNPGDKDAYTHSLNDLRNKLLNSPEKNLSEVWFSSGLNRDLPFQYYLDLIKMVKQTVPAAMLKAFTAVEIDFLSKHFDKPLESLIDELIEAGLDRIPGGGAEILDPQIRKKIDIKTSPENYLRIHQLFHQRDIPTSMTMLFGHVENRLHRIRHMETIRQFQDESKGVQAFIPLAYQDKNNPLAKKGIRGPSPVEILKTLAISRIYLDNVDHIQSFWIDSGADVTQISLHFGIDDVNGTLIEENIAHASGSPEAVYEKEESLKNWILEAGLIPAERDGRFRIIRTFDSAGSAD